MFFIAFPPVLYCVLLLLWLWRPYLYVFLPCVLYCCSAHIHICMYVMALPNPWRVFLLIFVEFVLVSYPLQITSSPTTFLFFRQVKWSFLISPFLTVNSPPGRQNKKKRKHEIINGNKKAATEKQLSLLYRTFS